MTLGEVNTKGYLPNTLGSFSKESLSLEDLRAFIEDVISKLTPKNLISSFAPPTGDRDLWLKYDRNGDLVHWFDLVFFENEIVIVNNEFVDLGVSDEVD